MLKQLKAEEEWLRRGVRGRLKRNEGRKERILSMREQAKKNPGIIRKVKLELERATKSFNQGGLNQNRKKMLFECENLAKSMDGKLLFSGFNARVLQGERIGIVGPNGSGKTTLLNCISTIDTVTSGHIYVEEKDITILHRAQRAKKRRYSHRVF